MDYNIYLRTISTTREASPTTPWQVSGEGGSNEVIGDGFSPASAITRGAAVLRNPDSLISGVLSTGIAKAGIIGIAFMAAIHITDRAITMYQSYAAPASGDFKTSIDYNNFKVQIHNTFHPFSTEIQRQQNRLQIKKENLANEQQRLLLGGTFLNSPYGRYL